MTQLAKAGVDSCTSPCSRRHKQQRQVRGAADAARARFSGRLTPSHLTPSMAGSTSVLAAKLCTRTTCCDSAETSSSACKAMSQEDGRGAHRADLKAGRMQREGEG